MGLRVDRSESLQCGDRTDHAIFVEAEAPVRAAVVGAVPAADLGVPRLRDHAFRGEQRMRVVHSCEDLARIVHAHPTLSEAVHEAAMSVDKRAIHKMN